MRDRALFVDTGGWVALRYRRDQYHALATKLLKQARREGLELVSSQWVLAETVTLLKARGAIDHALAIGEAMQGGRLGRFVEVTAERSRRAWELFRRFRDLRAGYVDCTSFAIMAELGLSRVFGFDEDFAAAGFTLYGQ